MAELAAMKVLRQSVYVCVYIYIYVYVYVYVYIFKDRTNNWSLVKQDPSFSV